MTELLAFLGGGLAATWAWSFVVLTRHGQRPQGDR